MLTENSKTLTDNGEVQATGLIRIMEAVGNIQNGRKEEQRKVERE